jgi:hypothetical protein
MNLRLVAVLLSCLMVWNGNVSAQELRGLKIVVLEGEGTTNNLQIGSSQPPMVLVQDENDRPVAGANVTFFLPERGPGGTFFGVWNKLNVTTNEQGRASGNGFRANQTEGSFQILVTAAEGERTASVNITQSNVRPADGVSRVLRPVGKLGNRKLLAVLAAGAIAGVAVAARGGNDNSPSTLPGTSITPGTISIGTPR